MNRLESAVKYSDSLTVNQSIVPVVGDLTKRNFNERTESPIAAKQDSTMMFDEIMAAGANLVSTTGTNCDDVTPTQTTVYEVDKNSIEISCNAGDEGDIVH